MSRAKSIKLDYKKGESGFFLSLLGKYSILIRDL